MKITVEFESDKKENDSKFEIKVNELLGDSDIKSKIVNIIPTGTLTLDLIESCVCKHFSRYYGISITPAGIKVMKKKGEFVITRQVCYYLARKNKLGTWADIAYRFGGKDHATAIHGFKTIQNLLDTNKEFVLNHKHFIESFLT